jgi:hypothetical protein
MKEISLWKEIYLSTEFLPRATTVIGGLKIKNS